MSNKYQEIITENYKPKYKWFVIAIVEQVRTINDNNNYKANEQQLINACNLAELWWYERVESLDEYHKDYSLWLICSVALYAVMVSKNENPSERYFEDWRLEFMEWL